MDCANAVGSSSADRSDCCDAGYGPIYIYTVLIMSTRKILELFLDRVEMDNCMSADSCSGRHVLMTSLIWPRPAISERSSIKTFEMDENQLDLGKTDWVSRILCKEVVEGTFGVKVFVTEQLSDSKLSDFIAFAGSTVLKLAGGEVEDLFSTAIAGGVAEMPFTFFSKLIKDSGEMPADLLGSGTVEVKISTSSKAAKKITLEIPLTVPQTVYRSGRKSGHGKVTTRRRSVLTKGESNGKLFLTARIR